MLNLDEMYHSYLGGHKQFNIDGVKESIIAYGWHCDGNDITGHYVTTENHKLFYNRDNKFVRKESLAIK